MPKAGKILVVSQHYPPDSSTTAIYIAAIAEGLAINNRVIVLSGSPNSSSGAGFNQTKPEVVEIQNWTPQKGALVKRAIAISSLALRSFFATLNRAKPSDVVLSVTTPFTLPYAVALAARLRGAANVLLVYDLYPEVLEAAGLVKQSSLVARLIRLANSILFRRLDAIITIGRDVGPLLLAYKDVTPTKIHFIPNWTLLPVGYREPTAESQFRSGLHSRLIVGLSGNLGFTHSPHTVFEAARLLKTDPDVHFILSGWGIGWKQLTDLQATDRLDNVTLLNPVPQTELAEFLASADVWIIPYRRNITGVSVPSRLYNLMAVGRAVIVAAEAQTEAALVIDEEQMGWVVAPEDPHQLANAIRLAASDRAGTKQKGQRAAAAAQNYSQQAALARYHEVVLNVQNHRLRLPDDCY
jgi:colanic acid biosynthesis glycosyl transferase WcaI